MTDNFPEKIELSFARKRSKNGIAYKNNNDTTKTIRVSTSSWQVFSKLSLSQEKARKEMFDEMLAYYIRNSGELSESQAKAMLDELQNERD